MALRLGPNLRAIVSLRKLRARSKSTFFIHNLMLCQNWLTTRTNTELCSKITIVMWKFQQPIKGYSLYTYAKTIIQQVSLILGTQLSNWSLTWWSCRIVMTVVPVEQLAASMLSALCSVGRLDWSSKFLVGITRKVPRLWTSSPKNQQCHLLVSLSPFSCLFSL